MIEESQAHNGCIRHELLRLHHQLVLYFKPKTGVSVTQLHRRGVIVAQRFKPTTGVSVIRTPTARSHHKPRFKPTTGVSGTVIKRLQRELHEAFQALPRMYLEHISDAHHHPFFGVSNPQRVCLYKSTMKLSEIQQSSFKPTTGVSEKIIRRVDSLMPGVFQAHNGCI